MRRLTRTEFLAERVAYDESVSRTPETPRFTASFLWQMAAVDSLQPPRGDDEWLIVEEKGNWIVFAERERRRVFLPLEAAWLFSAPLIGDPEACVDLLGRAAARWLKPPFGFCFGGVRVGGRLHEALRSHREKWLRYEEFAATDTMGIDLVDGYTPWLDRRSKKFRKAVRQLRVPNGLEIERADQSDPDSSIARILTLQQRSPKAESGGDIFAMEPYLRFYRKLIEGLHREGNLRLLFARLDGRDAAYILGGRFGRDYRGLQMSYAAEFREIGLGNFLQLENLRSAAEEGIETYDLGMHAPYKERWADRRDQCTGLFFQP